MNARRISTALALSLAALAACGSDGSDGSDGSGQAGSTEVAADLKFLREEEKLARDVYLTLYEVWQLKPHQNIALAEQTHTDRVKDSLAALTISDPVVDDTVGTFVDPSLAKLYEALTTQGKTSEVASLRVAASVEELDLRDLEVMKSHATNPAILSMYEALQCGSRNHLRSFTSNLAQRGETYEAVYLGAEAVQAILAAGQEPCDR